MRQQVTATNGKLGLDPIAEAIRQWEDHDLSAIAHMEAVTALNRVQQLVVTRIEQALKPFGVNFPQYEALVLLHFSREGALPLGSMGRRLMVHPTTVTNTIDQLETKRFVTRQRSSADRRRVLATITPQGRAVAHEASEVLAEMRFGIGEMKVREARELASRFRDFRIRIDDFLPV